MKVPIQKLLIISIFLNVIVAILLVFFFFSSGPSGSSATVEREGTGHVHRSNDFGRWNYIDLRNVAFYWDDNVYITTEHLRVKSNPLVGSLIDMERPDSFSFEAIDGSAAIDTRVLTYLMNTKVFGLPGSSVRNMSVSTALEKGQRILVISGEIDLSFWIHFEMKGDVTLGEQDDTVMIKSRGIKALGFPHADSVLNLFGVTMDTLMKVPKDGSVKVLNDGFLIKPFLLFRNPSISGSIKQVAVVGNSLKVVFKTMENSPLPSRLLSSPNDMLIFGGDMKIGSMLLQRFRMQLVDADPTDLFQFHIQNYFRQLSESSIRVYQDGSLLVRMPDSSDLPK